MIHDSNIDKCEIFYVYDGSFEGLLSVVYTAVYSRVIPCGISTDKTLQFAFATRYVDVETNRIHARKVHDALYKKIGTLGLKRLYYLFLSNHINKDLIIYNYMMLGFKNGQRTNSALTNDTVANAFKIAESVSRETEKFRQFTRFNVMQWGVQYAKIAPVNNILPILTPFFVKRLKIIPFVIHDITHDVCAIYDTKEWRVVSSEGLTPPEFSEDEMRIKDLWETFFNAITIEPRKNTKLQKQNMPARYFRNVWSIK